MRVPSHGKPHKHHDVVGVALRGLCARLGSHQSETAAIINCNNALHSAREDPGIRQRATTQVIHVCARSALHSVLEQTKRGLCCTWGKHMQALYEPRTRTRTGPLIESAVHGVRDGTLHMKQDMLGKRCTVWVHRRVAGLCALSEPCGCIRDQCREGCVAPSVCPEGREHPLALLFAECVAACHLPEHFPSLPEMLPSRTHRFSFLSLSAGCAAASLPRLSASETEAPAGLFESPRDFAWPKFAFPYFGHAKLPFGVGDERVGRLEGVLGRGTRLDDAPSSVDVAIRMLPFPRCGWYGVFSTAAPLLPCSFDATRCRCSEGRSNRIVVLVSSDVVPDRSSAEHHDHVGRR